MTYEQAKELYDLYQEAGVISALIPLITIIKGDTKC